MNDQTVLSAEPRLSRGWFVTFLFLGAVMSFDGVTALAAGLGPWAASVEAVGKALGGAALALHGAIGLRDGRGSDLPGAKVVGLVGVACYAVGSIAGSEWWRVVVG